MPRSGIAETPSDSRLWVVHDEYAIVIADPDHSSLDEERFLILGYSSVAHLLVVSHCYRGGDDVIRIISARKATNNEVKQYRNRKGNAK